MKRILLVFSLLFISLFNAQNNPDQQGLKPIIEQIIDGFSSKNADKINAFVNKDLGIGVVFKSEKTKIDANWTLTFFDLLNIYNFIPNFSFSVSKHTNTNFPL
ncbi:hypothetical protein [Soonwooa sp.]|uniref:hypothetical protein n=1 Tax=Soonwooa sp. TaxID=1938592 RepID=UPI0028A690F7|nr:hypothetical protein [Soonwooa sp.]